MIKKFFIYLIIIAILLGGGSLFFNSSSSSSKDNSNIGQKAPDFSLPDINGQEVKLSSFLGKNVVLFFNEGLMCYPACLDQVVSLSKDEKLNNDQIVSFSIVVDTAKDWQKAYKDLPYLEGVKVLFDSGTNVSRAYNVLSSNSSMHVGQRPGHTYVTIDKEGIIRYVFDDVNMGIRNDLILSEIWKY